MVEFGGAKYVGSSKAGEPRFAPIVKFDPNFAGSYLGFEVALETVEEKLKLIGCEIEKKSSTEWLIDPPSWRADLLTGPDLVEEVARNIGFDQIPSRLPTGSAGARLSDLQYRKRAVANFLADNGFSEVYNYPFVNPKYLADLGFTGDRAKAFRIANPMSEEFPDLRTHLLPGLLLTAQRNQGRGHKTSAIFEIGSVFRDNVKLPEVPKLGTSSRPSEGNLSVLLSAVPLQPLHIGALVTGSIGKDDWAGAHTEFTWSDAIAFAKKIIEETGNTVEVSSSDFAPWHPGRCAELQVDGKPVAHAGELHPRVLSMLGLPARSCAFVVILSALPFKEVRRVNPILTMPSATQDLSVVVSKDVAAQDVMNALRKGAGELLEKIDLFDRYDQIGEGKISLSFTLTFRAADRTLTAEEVSGYRLSALEQASKDCGAVIRS
jgi:phenylalanyl-tRNA synthetase beta chain